MSAWFAEMWFVFCRSSRTQSAVAFGVLFFGGIKALGLALTSSFELHGPLAMLTEVLRDALMYRYDKAAWVALATFVVLAVKTFRNDRRRYLGS
jgi:hypothetical protein